MVYIFDTNSFLELQSYYPETFPTFWESFNELVASGRVVSVAEVLKELDFQATAQHLIDWIDQNKRIFIAPSAEEMQYVAEIFRVKHFQQLIGAKQLARGMPVADPFLVAKARALSGCVVTQESRKPNSAKVPNVCDHFGVDCVNLQGALLREGWRF